MPRFEPNPPTKQIYTLSGDSEHSALDLLAQQTGLKKQLLKTYAAHGAVWFTRSKRSKPERLRRLKKILDTGQTLTLYYNPDLHQQNVEAATLIDDRQDYSVWLKPRGMLSQGSKWADHTALYRWVELNYQPNNQLRQGWIVHRLDRATCGLMLIAHNKKTAAKLSNLFEQKQVHKTYKALVWGEFAETQLTVSTAIDEKPAISHITCLEVYSGISLLEIKIETGRKHQIRRHLSSLNYPIIGDRLYGDSERDKHITPTPDLQLTAYKIEFECPLDQQLKSYLLKDSQLDLLSTEKLEKHSE